MNPVFIFKVATSAFFVAVGLVNAVIGFRELRLTATKLSIQQKIVKSLKVGLLFAACVFFILIAFFVFLRKDFILEIDAKTMFSVIGCLFIPCLIVITIGIFVQINYLELLIHSGKKK